MKGFGIGLILYTLGCVAFADVSTPYAGQESRDLKALSAQEVKDYLDGKGMGYAKAAELNHFPGPRHVLDLAKELGLTEDQKTKTESIFVAMQKQAIELGTKLIDKERELDRKFSDRSIDDKTLETLIADMGSIQAMIRYTHLRAHLEQRELLTPQQIHEYDRLRGYGSQQTHSHEQMHHQH